MDAPFVQCVLKSPQCSLPLDIGECIFEFLFRCRCVGHPLAQDYCDFCCRASEGGYCDITGRQCDDLHPPDPPAPIQTTFTVYGNTGHVGHVGHISAAYQLDNTICLAASGTTSDLTIGSAICCSGTYNSAFGCDALLSLRGGTNNTGCGSDTGTWIENGSFNSCFGKVSTGSSGAGSGLGPNSSGNVCIAHPGFPTDNCTIRLGNRRDHQNVYLPNRTHLDMLVLPEFLHPAVRSGDTVMINSQASIMLVPVTGPFPLKYLTFHFPKPHPEMLGNMLRIVCYGHFRGVFVEPSVTTMMITGDVIGSPSYFCSRTQWFLSSELNAWIRVN